MKSIKKYFSAVIVVVFFLFILPLVTLADGDTHPPEEEHPEEEAASEFNPVVGLIGVALAIGTGFGVWIFMQKKGGTKEPSKADDKPKTAE